MADEQVEFELVAPERLLLSRAVEMVVVPGEDGDFGVLPRHAPLLTDLRPGEVRVQVPEESEERFFYVTGGILEVQPHLVTVLADTALHADELDTNCLIEATAVIRGDDAYLEEFDRITDGIQADLEFCPRGEDGYLGGIDPDLPAEELVRRCEQLS